ncbi:MAG: hypothetical protein KGI71_05265 [Patescibacteria group bacterium]|nr:hypothetical protein [Patescibacteria group bacterium]
MDNQRPLNLNDASLRTGVAVVTLRRMIKDGRLMAEPRNGPRDPYLLSLETLERAGLRVGPEPIVAPVSVIQAREVREDSRLGADLAASRAEVGHLRAQVADWSARAHRAEGELAATRRDFDSVVATLAPALSALSQRPEPEPRHLVSADTLERSAPHERPRRRWFQSASA